MRGKRYIFTCVLGVWPDADRPVGTLACHASRVVVAFLSLLPHIKTYARVCEFLRYYRSIFSVEFVHLSRELWNDLLAELDRLGGETPPSSPFDGTNSYPGLSADDHQRVVQIIAQAYMNPCMEFFLWANENVLTPFL